MIYLIKCRVYGKQYNGSTMIKFPAGANNYKNTHCNLWEEQKLSNQNVTRNTFTNTIFRVTIMRFATGR